MSTFRGTDDAGRVAEPLDPENLRELLQQASTSVDVQAAVDGLHRGILARRDGAEGWRLEVRGEDPQQQVVAHVPNTDATFDVIRSWCAADGWWQDAFTWEPLTS